MASRQIQEQLTLFQKCVPAAQYAGKSESYLYDTKNRLMEVNQTGSLDAGSFALDYDANGNMTKDSRKRLQISHNVLNLPMIARDTVGNMTSTMTYTFLGDGTKAGARVRTIEQNVMSNGKAGKRYRGSFVYDVSDSGVQTLESIDVSTGRLIAISGNNRTTAFRSDAFITDHLGNVAAVFNLSGRNEMILPTPGGLSRHIRIGTGDHILEQNDYLPFGTRMPLKTQATNRYRYAGKEEQNIAGVDLSLLDFGARYYDAFTCRWNAIDPMANKYFGMSPYNYCGNDSVNMVDPDGTYVKVCDNGNGTYTVVGGELDGDMNIYVYTQDKDGEYTVRGESIGETATPYTFYDSDPNKDGSGPKGWAVGAVIDPHDDSRIDFMKEATDPSVSLLEYMWKARGGKVWDFKLANLPEEADVHNYANRGLPLGQNSSGKTIYASARDIGNIAAGKMAGMRGYSWESTSAVTDAYQIFQCIIGFAQIRREGPSTKYAQHLGWNMSKTSNVCQIKK